MVFRINIIQNVYTKMIAMLLTNKTRWTEKSIISLEKMAAISVSEGVSNTSATEISKPNAAQPFQCG